MGDDIEDSENDETQAREVSDEDMDSDEEQQRYYFLSSTIRTRNYLVKYFIFKKCCNIKSS